MFHPQTVVPLVGASGAIAAAMGAFLVIHYTVPIRFLYFFWFGGNPLKAPSLCAPSGFCPFGLSNKPLAMGRRSRHKRCLLSPRRGFLVGGGLLSF